MTSALVSLGPSAVEPVPESSGGREIRPLSADEVKATVEWEIQTAIGHFSSVTSEERRKALRYYYGREFGNEQEGRSKVVLTDVADTIEWILPSIMRMFLGGHMTVRYKERRADQTAGAQQATAFVNADFRDNQDGFILFYNWCKDALLEKNGFVKLTHEERVEPKRETYRGLTIEGLAMLLLDERLQPVAFEERPDGLYTVVTVQAEPVSRIVAEGVPPEEFLIAQRARKLNDATPFVAHRRKVTRSDLIALGYPKNLVLSLPQDNSVELSGESVERRAGEEDEIIGTAMRMDVASEELWLNDCWIRLDEDGDGYSELRNIMAVGDSSVTILEDEEVNHQPFCSLCPVPMPHKFFGISIADQLSDLQLIRSTLLRQMLDNLYLTNNPQLEVVEGQVELDDLLAARPGNLVRVLAPGMVNPIVIQPLSPMAFNMMEWLEGLKENRVGASRWMQGIDASALKSTATGITSMMAAAQARVELIARIFAETGIKDFFRKYLKLLVETPMKKRAMKVRGEWVEIDPSAWSTDMDLEIEVGLGTGQAAERMAFLAQVLQIQAATAQGGLTHVVTPQNVYNAANKMAETMGFQMPDLFFTDPQGQPPPPKEPDPRVYESDRRAKDNEGERELKKTDLIRQAATSQADVEFRRLDLEERMKIEREKIASQERIALRKCELDAELARTQARAKKANGKEATA